MKMFLYWAQTLNILKRNLAGYYAINVNTSLGYKNTFDTNMSTIYILLIWELPPT
jgi:hypothetical protein